MFRYNIQSFAVLNIYDINDMNCLYIEINWIICTIPIVKLYAIDELFCIYLLKQYSIYSAEIVKLCIVSIVLLIFNMRSGNLVFCTTLIVKLYAIYELHCIYLGIT